MLSFDEAVERIKTLERTLQRQEVATAFEEGDLALEQAPIGKDGAHNSSTDTLARLAAESDVDVETLRQRRFVASRVSPGMRIPGVPWSGWLLLAGISDPALRDRALQRVQTQDLPEGYRTWNVNAIRRILGKAPTNATNLIAALEHASPESKVEAFTTLATDDHIVEEASDYTTPTAGALGRLEVASSHRAAQRTQAHYADDPVLQASDATRALFDLVTTLRVFAEQVEELLPRCRQIPLSAGDPLGHDVFLAAALDRAVDAMRQVAYLVTNGRTDLDDFLGEVLQQERRD